MYKWHAQLPGCFGLMYLGVYGGKDSQISNNPPRLIRYRRTASETFPSSVNTITIEKNTENESP